MTRTDPELSTKKKVALTSEGHNMITNERELEATQDRIAHFQRWLAGIRKTARPEEFDAVASG